MSEFDLAFRIRAFLHHRGDSQGQPQIMREN